MAGFYSCFNIRLKGSEFFEYAAFYFFIPADNGVARFNIWLHPFFAVIIQAYDKPGFFVWDINGTQFFLFQ